MTQESIFDYEIPVVFNGNNSIDSSEDPNGIFSWDISLEVEQKGFYGYGYGTAFYELGGMQNINPLDYFYIIGASGSGYGYGISSTKGRNFDEYYFGWGYEFAPEILSDGNDSISIVATVTKNDSPVENVRVVFISDPSVSLSVNSGLTDNNGQIETVASINNKIIKKINIKYVYNDSNQNIYKDESIPISGMANVRAYIDKIPQKEEMKILIKCAETHKVYGESQFNLIFGSYAFQLADINT